MRRDEHRRHSTKLANIRHLPKFPDPFSERSAASSLRKNSPDGIDSKNISYLWQLIAYKYRMENTPIKLFSLPNLITLGNLLCGAGAAVAALAYGNLTLAFLLIVGAIVCDYFDGFVARLLGQTSPLGIQLDSLADMVTSGFAPAAILFRLYETAEARWTDLPEPAVWFVLTVTAGAALRLARFNIDDTQHTEFRGLPAPAAALFFASLGMLAEKEGLLLPREIILLAAAAISGLMISPVRMFSFKFRGFGWSGNRLRYLFLLTAAGLFLGLKTYAIPTIIVLYIVVSAVRWIFLRTRRNGPTT